MKYHCKNCGGEYKHGKTTGWPSSALGAPCLFCGKRIDSFGVIPDYETLEQYEKRTGKMYPDDRLTWYRARSKDDNYRQYKWDVATYREAKLNIAYSFMTDKQIVIADPPVPPPDDWRPE